MTDNDGKNVKLSISADGYKAYLTVRADTSTKKMTTGDLNSLLERHKIVFGIKKDVLLIVTARLKQGTSVERILVAEGIEPFEGRAPKVDYKFELSSKPKETESGRVDYRSITTILNVEKDQLLAVKQILKPPRNGMTVTGKSTPFKSIPDIPVLTGDNVTKEETGDVIHFKAGCDGALKFENQVLLVFPTLEIREDVDFNVGNISFKGDIKIGRDVLPDFTVEANGSIKVRGSAIACQLKAGDSIEIGAGIVGKNKGAVETGGDLTATFVENATLKAKGNIDINNGIIGSQVFCDGALDVKMRRSRIVGSTVRAATGITAFNVGSRFDTGTQLTTGIFPDKEKSYLNIKKTLDARWGEAKELEKRYGRSTLENKSFSRNISDSVKRDIDKWDFLKKQIKTIIGHLKKAEEEMYDHNVIIRIKETLYPRVELQIGKHKITASKEYFDVRVLYSEETGKIVIK